MRFDILNRLGMAHECDGQTEPALAIAQSNDSLQNFTPQTETRTTSFSISLLWF